MRKSIALLGLWLSIAGASYAQQITATYSRQKDQPALSPDDRVFELPAGNTGVRFWADLGKGNGLRLELVRRADLIRFENIDSLLLIFLGDMGAFRDSLGDPLSGKRIDYLMDTAGLKKVRIRQTRPSANSYVLDGGEPALLRLHQDTVFLLLPVTQDNSRQEADKEPRYDRLGLFINRYEDLPNFITAGLNAKVRSMETRDRRISMDWMRRGDRVYLNADRSISSDLSSEFKGVLSLRYAVSVQNYKNYFNPSFSLGTTISIGHGNSWNSFSADWEPTFIFSPDAQGRLQTYRNDFLVIGYSNRNIGHQPKKDIGFHLNIDFSLGYLIDRQGDYFEKHTFRFCAGAIKLAGDKIRIEPCMYFHDFFRGVTPGVRITL